MATESKKKTSTRQTRSAKESSVEPKKTTRSRKASSTEKPAKEPKVSKPKTISPFDIIGMMFRQTGEFENLSKFVLERNLFMINRTCAIAYPLQAQMFNKLGISGPGVIRAWRDFLLRQHGYGRVPSFVYTRGSKAVNDKVIQTSPLKDFSKDDITAYCEHYQISGRDFQDLQYFNTQQLVRHMYQFCNITSGKFAIEKQTVKKTKTQK